MTPGTSWSNPIWHGEYRIYRPMFGPFAWAFQHDDFEGSSDSMDQRHGHGETVEDCKRQIDAMEKGE